MTNSKPMVLKRQENSKSSPPMIIVGWSSPYLWNTVLGTITQKPTKSLAISTVELLNTDTISKIS